MILTYIIITLLGACWGSFLNSIAWRLASYQPLTYHRSYCPTCHHHITWYDLIPIISWIALRGTCRHCHARISPLYPAIEAGTAILSAAAYGTLPLQHIPWYSIFASLLIITIHTDFRYHVISPIVTLYVIPASLFAAYWNVLPITWYESLLTASFAYGLFALLNILFQYRTGQQAIGEGDWELIAYIASVIGYQGFVYTILGGSIITLFSIALPYYRNTPVKHTPLPFGAGLACMAVLYPLYTL